MALEFGVLGPLVVWSDGKTVPVSGAKRRGLLAFLLAHVGEPQPLDRIVDALWTGSPSRGAESTVQTYISQFRKLFAADGLQLVHRAGGYVLDFDANALDATRFEVAVSAASAIDDRERRLGMLDEALRLWRGAPLDEFAGQAWADERARQWTRMHVLAHQLRAAALLDSGRHRDALPTLEQLVAAHRLHEPFWAQLVVARYRCGQQADALAAVSEARKVLATELGIDPGPELIELENKVLAHDVSLDAPTRREIASADVVRAVTVVEPLPDGVVTLLLTDIEGSTTLWDQHPDQMAKALVRHEDVIADVVQAHNGRLLKSRGEGDATLSVFMKVTDGVAAAVALQRRLQNEPWPGGVELATRVALHTGEAHVRDGDYYGGTVNRAARIRSLAAGGQVLLSHAVHDLVVDVLAPELELVSVGEHELKGLRRAENVYAIRGPGLDVEVRAYPQKVITGPRTSFIGRGDLVREIDRALHDPGLATLVGPGGIGKTRLLEEACARFGDRFERVWRVDLVAARGRAGVESLLEMALLPERDPMDHSTDGIPRPGLMTDIVSLLGGRRVLVALDNCEQVLDVLPEIVESLLQRAPTLTVLATSREPLGARGEVVIPVAPLELPSDSAHADPARLQQVEAVDLLLTRARERGARIEVTVETARDIANVCRQLDGIPLGLELAAARLASTSVRDLAKRLPRQLELLTERGTDPRHRTMRNVIDSSYQLLEATQQVLLRRLGIFVGGFTLEAAEEVCSGNENNGLPFGDAVYLNLSELVAKSLVVFDRDRSRYRLLEPIRQYARDLLESSGELPHVAGQHARWAYRHSFEVLAAGLTSAGRTQRRFDVELDNIHAALEWLRENDPKAFLRLVSILGYCWFFTDWRRGRAIAELAVTMATDASERLRAGVFLTRGMVEQRHDLFGSIVWLKQARSLYLRNDEAIGTAWSTLFLARAHTELHPDVTQRLYLESVERFHALGMAIGELWALLDVTHLAQDYGRIDEARGYLERLVALAHHAEQTSVLGVALALRARNTAALGNPDSASREMRQAIELQQAGGEEYMLVEMLYDAAWIELQAGRVGAAEDYVYRALRLGLQIEHWWGLRVSLVILAVVESRHGNNERGRMLVAATGWDLPRPNTPAPPPHAVWIQALKKLEHLDKDEYEAAVHEGHALGVFGAARASLR